MSISISLLPFALAVRLIMGKNNFENWVNAQQTRVSTLFRTELDLVRTVKKTGYDAVRFGSAIKTHIDREKVFFFWEYTDETWFAVFPKYIKQTTLDEFMKAVEATAGQKVFNLQTATVPGRNAPFPTNFTDQTVLLKTLREFGANPEQSQDGSIACQLGSSDLHFRQPGSGLPFTVEIINAPSLELTYETLTELDEDYRRCVQTAVYEKVKARAIEKNMTVESEEVLSDKTILLTLRVS